MRLKYKKEKLTKENSTATPLSTLDLHSNSNGKARGTALPLKLQ